MKCFASESMNAVLISFRFKTLRCDHCRRELGLNVQHYWRMRFCSSACMAVYQQRLTKETKEKIRRLDIPA
jgi:hypothetical protein